MGDQRTQQIRNRHSFRLGRAVERVVVTRIQQIEQGAGRPQHQQWMVLGKGEVDLIEQISIVIGVPLLRRAADRTSRASRRLPC